MRQNYGAGETLQRATSRTAAGLRAPGTLDLWCKTLEWEQMCVSFCYQTGKDDDDVKWRKSMF